MFSTVSPIDMLIGIGLGSIVLWHVVPVGRTKTRLIAQLVLFAAMTLVLVGNDISPVRFEGFRGGGPQALPLQAAKLLWWLHLAWALIGLVRIYLVLEGRPREARLLQDLVVGIVYLGMACSMLAFVFGVPIGTLVATSGVVAILLGLALQSTLGDVFSGIALTVGRPYVIGDWILLADGTEGRVVESNWRSTHLRTSSSNIVVLPNSFLAKLALTNISRPTETHFMTLPLRIAPTRMPSVVVEVMRAALASSNAILQTPTPAVVLLGLDASALAFELQFAVGSPSRRVEARNEVLDRVYRHCKAAGLLLALPPTAAFAANIPTEETAQPPVVTPLDLIDAMPIFGSLVEEEKTVLAASAVVRSFERGEVIVREGERLTTLMMIRAGTVARRCDGEPRGFLSPGDCFGETGLLTGAGEACTLEALSRVTAYALDQDAFSGLLADRPALAEDLALHLSQGVVSAPNGANVRSHTDGRVQAVLRSIQTVFHR